jgi:serine/threonine protein phosphatase 1
MAQRTFAIGDIHGDLAHLTALFELLPPMDEQDTIVFLGDFLDRGPQSAQVVDFVRTLPERTAAKVVSLRGSHEDGWLKVLASPGGFLEFTMPPGNGCLVTLRSYRGAPKGSQDGVQEDEFKPLHEGSFFPPEVVAWLRSLPAFYEDEHAIYVHAGLPWVEGRWVHPSALADPKPLFWQRTKEFYEAYDGKRVVFGHTAVERLPQDHSLFSPEDARGAYVTDSLAGIDTRCGQGGFLTALELPELSIYESRERLKR